MCGIVGAFGNLDGIDTAAMLAALVHRGPDGKGEYMRAASDAAGLWFGHTRLAIIDLSPTGAQPMQSEGGRYTIVFNGEIYNFRELRASLEGQGVRFRGHGDTEVILALIEAFGLEGALVRMRGMFAFAVWDEHDRTLMLARDRLGEKPLYYADLGGRFVFASEVRALLASGVVERQLDPDGLEAYLTFGAVADPLTLVHGVYALEAGTHATVGPGKMSVRRYWNLGGVGSVRMPKEEAVARTRDLLTRAEERCMVADVPVAVLLSGGIDSSSNVILLTLAGYRNLRTFSVTFPSAGEGFDEAQCSRLVSAAMSTQHREVAVGIEEARQLVPAAVAAMDQPSYDGVNTYVVCDAIRRAGIKVAVSGQGADELFLGYPQRRLFPWLEGIARTLSPWSGRAWRELPGARHVRRDSRAEKALQMAGGADPSSAAYLVGYGMFSWAAIQRLRGRDVPSPTRFVRGAGGEHALDRLSRLQTVNYLCNVLLRDADQMSMAHGVELRAPFVDSDLVEAVAAVPSGLRVERARNKPLLLDAVGPSLPREVWDRPKQGFTLPYARWMREGLRVADLKSADIGLDRHAMKTVEARFLAGENPTRFWTLQALAAWADRHRMGTRWL